MKATFMLTEEQFNEVSIPLCWRRDSETIIRFLNRDEITYKLFSLYDNCELYGCYLDGDGEIVVEDVYGNTFNL